MDDGFGLPTCARPNFRRIPGRADILTPPPYPRTSFSLLSLCVTTKITFPYWRSESTAVMNSVRGLQEKLGDIGGHGLCYRVSSFSVVLVISNVLLRRNTDARYRRAWVALLPGLKPISIRRWILLISGIFTLAVVIILKVDEHSRHHRMFKASPTFLLTAFFLLNLIPIIACSGLSKLPAPTQSRIVVARRSQRTVCHPNHAFLRANTEQLCLLFGPPMAPWLQ
jgi:hypothetical protein